MMWIKYTDTKEIRGHKYKTLLNTTTGAWFEINIAQSQSDSDPNLYIFAEYPGMATRSIYYGTQVECIRTMDKIGQKLNAKEIQLWE